jgi:uracil-DNA glycosylase family 4
MAHSASDMTPQALAALLGFYADSGVDALCEESAIDRFAQSAELAQTRKQNASRPAQAQAPATTMRGGEHGASPAPDARPSPAAAQQRNEPAGATMAAANPAQASQLTVPGEAVFKDARALAASASTIDELRAALDGFTGCNLRHSAKSLVFADGNPDADVMFIGEAPGRDEDLQGLPFVGRAGQLLDRMLAAIGMSRETAYITNMIPWRPPGNRTPAPHEIELCRPFIERHITLAAPKIVVMLGNVASKSLLNTDKGILSLRGGWMEYMSGATAIPAMPTLHPAYLLRNPAQKRLVWADLLALQQRLEELKQR